MIPVNSTPMEVLVFKTDTGQEIRLVEVEEISHEGQAYAALIHEGLYREIESKLAAGEKPPSLHLCFASKTAAGHKPVQDPAILAILQKKVSEALKDLRQQITEG